MNQGDPGRISDCGFRSADSGSSDNPQSAIRNPQLKTLVALATYNEIENLPGLVDEILRVLPAANVLVVDDNSPDGTGRWCDSRAANEPRLHCLHRSGKFGLGSATVAAVGYAIDQAYDVFITMDADWSHDPRHLPELLGALEHSDVTIGSRYVVGGAIEGWPTHRRIVSRVMNRLTRTVLRLPVRDASGAFRAYRVDKLRQLRLDRIRASGYAYLEEILWHLNAVGATFTEIPIKFRERRAGKSKIDLHEAVGKLRTLCRLAMGGHRDQSQ
jgi:dolichol-phosphate mannosyltransferase